MGSSQAVYIKSGDQPRVLNWAYQTAPASTTTVTGQSLPIYKESVYSTFQAILAGTGAVTATVLIQVSNDDLTGRGYIFSNQNAPGTLVTTTSGSATLAAGNNTFPAALVGLEISAVGVPIGTTVSAVAAGGASLTMSANATASATVQANFFANNWTSTPLGTITLTGTGTANDGFTSQAPWRYVCANVTAISGTGANVQVIMGV
jgi:hypothetical protein